MPSRIPPDNPLENPTPPPAAGIVAAHISDPHLSTAPGGPQASPWPYRIRIAGYKFHYNCLGISGSLFEQAVHIVDTAIQPDVLVITGDIVDDPSDQPAWELAGRILQQCKTPTLVALGDHDAASGPEPFRKYCGPLYRTLEIGETAFFVLPYNADESILARCEREFSAANPATRLRVLCMHRMLKTSWLMRALGRIFYGLVILSPHHRRLLKMLDHAPGEKLVLSGHAHTNYRARRRDTTFIATSALVEHPHEFRVLRIAAGRVETRLVRVPIPDAAAALSRTGQSGAASESRRAFSD